MLKILLILIILINFLPAYAYKVYSYDKNGYRVYKSIPQKDYAKNKHRPKRAYTRTPRYNKDITDEMRARNKRPYSYYTKNR